MNSELIKTNNNKHDPETWMDLYGDLLYRFALFRVKDTTAAEDIVQETFLAALGAYKNYKGHSTVRTWLIAILKYKSVDYIRKKVWEQRSNELEYLEDMVDRTFNGQGKWRFRYCKRASTPMQLYARKEFIEILYRCLSTLPERLAKAFVMREIDGLSTKEICETLNVTPTNCWVMLHRARQRLMACLGTCWFE